MAQAPGVYHPPRAPAGLAWRETRPSNQRPLSSLRDRLGGQRHTSAHRPRSSCLRPPGLDRRASRTAAPSRSPDDRGKVVRAPTVTRRLTAISIQLRTPATQQSFQRQADHQLQRAPAETRPVPPARLAQPFSCAVPTMTPIHPNGVRSAPSAGPYEVMSCTPGQLVVPAPGSLTFVGRGKDAVLSVSWVIRISLIRRLMSGRHTGITGS